MLGAAVGLGVGLGLTPSVAEARFVESAGFWGLALGLYASMLSELEDPTTVGGLMLGGLDLALATGIALAALGIAPPLGRTLWMDLGFLIGTGVGALIPSLYFVYQDEPIVWSAYGAGMMLGSIAGWVLAYFLTDGWEERRRDEEPVVHLGLAPLEGGAALTASGLF